MENQAEMLAKMREDISGIKALLSTMVNTNTIALEALQSAKSAHQRLDRLEKTVNWAGTTIVGAVIVGIISFFMRGN